MAYFHNDFGLGSIKGRKCKQVRSLQEWTAEEKNAVIQAAGGTKENLLAILLELQRLSGQNYIDEETAYLVADSVGMGRAQIIEVLKFYTMLKDKPGARYILEVCNSSPCHYSKADMVVAMLKEELGIGVGETTEDGLFTIAYTPCVGACEIGPVIKVGAQIWGKLTQEKVHEIIAELRSAD